MHASTAVTVLCHQRQNHAESAANGSCRRRQTLKQPTVLPLAHNHGAVHSYSARSIFRHHLPSLDAPSVCSKKLACLRARRCFQVSTHQNRHEMMHICICFTGRIKLHHMLPSSLLISVTHIGLFWGYKRISAQMSNHANNLTKCR